MKKIPKGFSLKKKGKIQYISCDAIEKTGLFEQGFTLRKAGFSKIPFNSLNVGLHTEDDKKTVEKNIKLIEKSLGVNYLAAAHQVHGDKIAEVRTPESGFRSQIQKQLKKTEADAVLTDVAGIAAGVRVADCAGTVIVDPVNKIIVSVHSGWRGVANKLPQKAVNLLKKKFKSDPKNLIAAVSPAIGPCCFEVGKDVYKLKKQKVFSNIWRTQKSKIYMNLWKGVRNLLLEAGMKQKNIHVCDICTSHEPEMFFSHRRDKGRTGRMLVFGIIRQSQNTDHKSQSKAKSS